MGLLAGPWCGGPATCQARNQERMPLLLRGLLPLQHRLPAQLLLQRWHQSAPRVRMKEAMKEPKPGGPDVAVPTAGLQDAAGWPASRSGS